jgi:hypothetical protein
MLPWLPNLNPPGTLDEVGLNMSSWPPCWGVAWFRWMGPPKFRDPAVDHIDDWLALDIWALFDNDGNSDKSRDVEGWEPVKLCAKLTFPPR